MPSIVGGFDIHRKQLTFDYHQWSGAGHAALLVRARIAPEQSRRPTWSGDRINASPSACAATCIDLVTIWPCLWLTVPDTVRTQIIAAGGQALARATTLIGWAVL
jgi:hypothetical protein